MTMIIFAGLACCSLFRNDYDETNGHCSFKVETIGGANYFLGQKGNRFFWHVPVEEALAVFEKCYVTGWRPFGYI